MAGNLWHTASGTRHERTRLGWSVALLIVATAVPALGQQNLAEESRPPAGNPANEATRIIARFRQAGKDPEKRAVAVREAMSARPAAIAALQAAIAREMAPQIKRYAGKFSARAAPLARARLVKTNWQDVAQLRETVLNLRQLPDLSEETIVTKADPAIKRLEELFVISPQHILAGAKDLQEDRQRLFEVGRLWEQCAQSLHERQRGAKEPPNFEKYLQGEEAMIAGLASPMDKATRAVLTSNARIAAQLDAEEARAILALNLTRNLLGLSALAIDVKLCAAARDHSADMAERGFFAHDSPLDGKKTPWDRAKRFGTSASAENIFTGVADGKSANQAWFDSPGHHKNMLAPHRRVGVGRHGTLFTQMFGD